MIAIPRGVVHLYFPQFLLQFVDQLDGKRGKIIDEVERILDLVGDAGGELAERRKLFGLHQAILRGAQVFQRFAQIVGALPQFVEQPRVLDGDHGLGGEVLHQRDLLVGERPHLLAINDDDANGLVVLEHRHGEKGPCASGFYHGHNRRIAIDIGLFGQHVGDMLHLFHSYGPHDRNVRRRTEHRIAPPLVGIVLASPMQGDRAKRIALT